MVVLIFLVIVTFFLLSCLIIHGTYYRRLYIMFNTKKTHFSSITPTLGKFIKIARKNIQTKKSVASLLFNLIWACVQCTILSILRCLPPLLSSLIFTLTLIRKESSIFIVNRNTFSVLWERTCIQCKQKIKKIARRIDVFSYDRTFIHCIV